jgi:DNA-binding NarL/FixJ family response regulator
VLTQAAGEKEITGGATLDCGLIAIVDDDPAFRHFLEELLVFERYATAVFASGEEFLRSLADRVPALVLLDVHLAGISGYDVSRTLRDRYGDDVAIIFVSGVRMEPHDRAAGLLLGADDYLIKPVDSGELVARMRRLLRTPYRHSNSQPQPAAPQLTRREQEILRLLAGGKSQKAISLQLFISSNTVATHIQRLLSKLEVHSRAEAVAAAYSLGLVETPLAAAGARRA